MRIVWVTRSFLDYRIPVYSAVSKMANNNFYLVFSEEKHVNPPRVVGKAKQLLGERAIALKGEKYIGKPYDPTNNPSSGYRFFYQPGLIKKIKALKPDVVITDAFNHWTIPILKMRMFGNIKHVMCYERTSHTERNSPRLKTFLRQQTFRWIDHLVVNGSLCTEYVTSLGYSSSKISEGNMAADTSALQQSVIEFSALEKIDLKKKLGLNNVVFLYTGSLIKLKGVEQLVDTWLSAFGSSTDVSLLMVGGGPEIERLEDLIERKFCNNIKFTDAVDYDSVFKYFAIADIFIIATLQDNWSLVVPEAMSCGLPIICSQYNGCWPELVKPQNGWIFDPLDPNNFEQALKTAWNEYPRWEEMGEASLRIVEEYSPEKMGGKIFEACKTTLNVT